MSAPTRVVHTGRKAYAVDPYVRDEGGRFANHPTAPLPPLQLLEDAADRVQVIDLSNGNGAAFTTGGDPSCTFRVRVIREEGGAYRVVYLED